MKPSLNRKYLLLCVLVFLLIGCYHTGINKSNTKISDINPAKEDISSAAADKTKHIETSSVAKTYNSGDVIFISNSHACQCTLQKCISIRCILQKTIAEKPEYTDLIKLLEIDYQKEPQKAEEIFKQYELWSIPSVIIRNKTGEIYYKSSYDFDETVFKDKLETMLKSNPKGQDK